MIKLGHYSTLEVVKTLSFGAYLDAGPFGEVLLPKRYVPRGLEAGDSVNVFLYCDSDDRVIATTEKPFATVGEFAGMVVKDVTSTGAYLDWGLMKDLLVPFREQSEKMIAGKVYIVKVLFDEATDRIYATSKISKYLLSINIITKKAYKYFMVLYNYPTELLNSNGKKNIAIKNLCAKYDISEATVYYVIAHPEMFRKK